jgi:hypothetical protein
MTFIVKVHDYGCRLSIEVLRNSSLDVNIPIQKHSRSVTSFMLLEGPLETIDFFRLALRGGRCELHLY